MTKEELAYADALNIFGSDIAAPFEAVTQEAVLYGLRDAAYRSAGLARCTYCPQTFPTGGPDDGEHFADLWEHLITAHGRHVEIAHYPARTAWGLESAA
jgi:hypothetical protein